MQNIYSNIFQTRYSVSNLCVSFAVTPQNIQLQMQHISLLPLALSWLVKQGTKHIIGHIVVKWPNQQYQSTEGR